MYTITSGTNSQARNRNKSQPPPSPPQPSNLPQTTQQLILVDIAFAYERLRVVASVGSIRPRASVTRILYTQATIPPFRVSCFPHTRTHRHIEQEWDFRVRAPFRGMYACRENKRAFCCDRVASGHTVLRYGNMRWSCSDRATIARVCACVWPGSISRWLGKCTQPQPPHHNKYRIPGSNYLVSTAGKPQTKF